MLRIRLSRFGKKRQPSYRVVVSDKKSPRDGRFVEQIGYYNPMVDPIEYKIREDRALHWLSVGAQPSDAVRRLLEKQGTIDRLARVHKGESIEDLTAEFSGVVAGAPEADAPEAVAEEAAKAEEVAETVEEVAEAPAETAEEAAPEAVEAVEETPEAVVEEPVVEEVVEETPVVADAPVEADDLTKLEGVGPKIGKTLIAGGLATYSAVAAASADDIKAILSEASIGANPETWPQQAALAADGKWDELKTLQDSLDGGRA